MTDDEQPAEGTPLALVADTSEAVRAAAARSRKVELIADCLRHAQPDDVPVVVAFLSGEMRQRRTGVGWATLRDAPPAARVDGSVPLRVSEVDATLQEIADLSGAGSQARRRDLVHGLLARASASERRLLLGLFSGELRQGALESVVTDAVARAAAVPPADLRRAVMLCGALAPVAAAVLAEGPAALTRFALEVGRPVQPMLASTATDLADALHRMGPGEPAAIEWKLDGVRVQMHRLGDAVRVFTRTLDDITERVPEVVELARSLPVDAVVLDAEAIALDDEARPRPFQITASRVATRSGAQREVALTTFVFDLLHLDGDDFVGRPARDRWAALQQVIPEAARVPRLVTADLAAAQEFYVAAVARGHEGVVVKSLDATYDAGRRGAGWLKVKPRHTLDLVVLAAEWGHGRRRGWLSNLHLGARDAETGELVMLGKTFKGLTDEMLRWQTERLLALAVTRDDWQVVVRPELVVEVAFDGVQTSPRYPGGMALRFARVLRYREDKSAAEANTVQDVRRIHAGITAG